MPQPKYVYFFGGGESDGNATMRTLLGGKGANLAEMSNLGIPVPPGFTISTEVCKLYYENDKQYPAGLDAQIDENLAKLEAALGAKFGDTENPLLLSVRSGAAVSMPGMMDTILNLGLNDDAVKGLIARSENERFAYDSYRRFVQMFGNVVLNVDHDEFEHLLEEKKKSKGVTLDTELEANDLEALVHEFKSAVKQHTGNDFPDDPRTQLDMARDAVFESSGNPARDYLPPSQRYFRRTRTHSCQRSSNGVWKYGREPPVQASLSPVTLRPARTNFMANSSLMRRAKMSSPASAHRFQSSN